MAPSIWGVSSQDNGPYEHFGGSAHRIMAPMSLGSAHNTVNLVLVRTLEKFVHHKLFMTGQLKMSCISSYSGHFSYL